MAEGDSVQDQIDDLRDRLIELNEIAQHVTLIGEALGLTRGMPGCPNAGGSESIISSLTGTRV